MSVAVRRALYGKLAGDSTLNALLATPPTGRTKSIYYQQAPSTANYPYVIFQKQAGTPRYSFKANAFDDEVWMVKGVDRNDDADPVDSISSRLDALLTDGTITISGKTELYLRRESDLDYEETVGDQRFLHAGSLYRLVYT
jgi:hypothetical protein